QPGRGPRGVAVAQAGADGLRSDNKPSQRPHSAACLWGRDRAAPDVRPVLRLGGPEDRGESMRSFLHLALVAALAAPAFAAEPSPDVPTAGPVQIPYLNLHRALVPGATGFLQYSFVGTPATPTTPLSSVRASWTSVAAMIAINQTNVLYQPDPTDAASQ